MKRLSAICLVGGLLASSLTAMAADNTSIKDQVRAIDRELAPMLKNAQSDPEVKAARAQLQIALDKMNATVNAVLIRTNPKAKELLARNKKLMEEFQAEQKSGKTDTAKIP